MSISQCLELKQVAMYFCSPLEAPFNTDGKTSPIASTCDRTAQTP